MNYSTIENLVWANPEHTMFDCVVNFEGIGVVPFSCTNTDPVAHSQEIWTRAMSGEFGSIAEYAPWQPPEDEQVTATPPSGNIPASVL
jgi:hypothetical protein